MQVAYVLWALGVEGQGHMAQVADVTGGGFGGDGLPLAAVLVWLQDEALLLRLDLLGGGGPDHRAVLVQLILQPLDQLVLLVQLQLQLVYQGVALPKFLDLLLQGILEVPQGPHLSFRGSTRSSFELSGVSPQVPLEYFLLLKNSILRILWGL